MIIFFSDVALCLQWSRRLSYQLHCKNNATFEFVFFLREVSIHWQYGSRKRSPAHNLPAIVNTVYNLTLLTATVIETIVGNKHQKLYQQTDFHK